MAYLVSNRHGIQSKSESYLKNHVQADTTVDNLGIYLLLKAAG